ncbi:hypothetical protein BS17DRAFT_773186 [Gyrodon lividus]|nr:hypothetical protein BS17DRAFT_773186 [Gyrodon lividus]
MHPSKQSVLLDLSSCVPTIWVICLATGVFRITPANWFKSTAVLYWYIPAPADEGYRNVEAIAQERGSKNKDVILINKDGLGDQYERQLKIFYDESVSSFDRTCTPPTRRSNKFTSKK